MISTSVFADSVKTQNVLVIHSYHQGLGWTASQLNQAFLAADTEFLLRFEAKAQSQNDGIRILDISLKAMPYQATTEPQILFEARDMTSRRQMEQKLREREVSYHLLYEQQPVILLTIDNSARIQSVNQFAADLLGYHKRDLIRT
ncbi:PAS domain-containing protein [Photobacterium damselae subsp. piscicida]|nr:PAS domain-containing protein [Photobacterium damselae subsp. piscicida]